MDGLIQADQLAIYIMLWAAALATAVLLKVLFSSCDNSCDQQLKELEERLVVERRRCSEKVERLCGIDREAQAVVEALTSGRIDVVCKTTGRPALVIGGEVVCPEPRDTETS